jgi:2-keto-3-deoxy-6-phosphogluconate aldolase
MDAQAFLKQRLLCVAVIEHADDAVPLAEALLAGGLKGIEVTFRTAGGVNLLQTLAGPFGHTGVKFVPSGGITAANLPHYLALPQVAAVGGSWMAERKLVALKAWSQITALTAGALHVVSQTQVK